MFRLPNCIVAILLIPCLLLEPATAAFARPFNPPAPAASHVAPLECQALVAALAASVWLGADHPSLAFGQVYTALREWLAHYPDLALGISGALAMAFQTHGIRATRTASNKAITRLFSQRLWGAFRNFWNFPRKFKADVRARFTAYQSYKTLNLKDRKVDAASIGTFKSAERYGIPAEGTASIDGPSVDSIPRGEGFYGQSLVVYLDPDLAMQKRINRMKKILSRSLAFQRNKIQFYPNAVIHHTFSAIEKYQMVPVDPMRTAANLSVVTSRVTPSRAFNAFVNGVGLDGAGFKIALQSYFTEGFRKLEGKVRLKAGQPVHFGRIDFNFAAIVQGLDEEEIEDLQMRLDSVSFTTFGEKRITQVDLATHDNDYLIQATRMPIKLEDAQNRQAHRQQPPARFPTSPSNAAPGKQSRLFSTSV